MNNFSYEKSLQHPDYSSYEEFMRSFFKDKKRELIKCLFAPKNNLYTVHSEQARLFLDPISIVRCKCGMVYQNYQPNQIDLDEFYSKSKAMETWSEIKKTNHEIQRQIEKYSRAVQYIEKFNIKEIIDLGCGNGFFLKLISNLFPKINLTGVELGSFFETSTKNLAYINQDILHFLGNTNKRADFICLFGVLEHVKNPIDLLKKIRPLLIGPKLIAIIVPNVESEVVERLWNKCFTFQPTHLWYFSIETLQRILDGAGFIMRDYTTIEAEETPVLKSIYGFEPYKEWPHWFEKPFKKLSELKSNILQTKKGYKILAIASPNKN